MENNKVTIQKVSIKDLKTKESKTHFQKLPSAIAQPLLAEISIKVYNMKKKNCHNCGQKFDQNKRVKKALT